MVDTEISVNYSLNHPNVVRLYEYFRDSREIYEIYELCSGGDLRNKILESNGLPEQVALQYLTELCQGLAYLEEEQVIHRDIKTENLLLDHEGRIKISDFGLSAKGKNLETPMETGS